MTQPVTVIFSHFQWEYEKNDSKGISAAADAFLWTGTASVKIDDQPGKKREPKP